MALTFFWRCEDTTLDATHDFTAGDNAATAQFTPAISATAAKIGSNGILFDSLGDHYQFAPASIMAVGAGSAAMWVQFTGGNVGTRPFFHCRGSSPNDFIGVFAITGGNLRLSIGSNTGPVSVDLDTASAGLTTGAWYFVVVAWDQAASDRYIGVYDSSLNLLAENEDTSTAFTAPTAFDDDTRLRFGDLSGSNIFGYLDNIFIGSAYADKDTFVSKANITSYTEYSGGVSGSGALTTSAALVAGSGTVTAAGASITGTGALDASIGTAAGTGTRGVQDTGSPVELLAATPLIEGVGTVDATGAVTGTGDLTAPTGTLAAAGSIGHVGSGALAGQTPLVAGIGAVSGSIGDGALVAGTPLVEATGIRGVNSVVALSARTPRISALVAVNGVYPSTQGLLPRPKTRTLRNPLRCPLKVSNG